MAANQVPIFVLTPNCIPVVMTVANIAADGSGTLYTALTAGTNGSRVNSITFTSSQVTVGASVLKVCRIYVTDAAGANPTLIGEIPLPLTTRSNTVIGATATFTWANGLLLKSGQLLKTSHTLNATAADNTSVLANGGDY